MSLLLDALRRAEEARRAKEADNKTVQTKSTVPAGKATRPQPTAASRPRELAIEEPVPTTAKKSPVIEVHELTSGTPAPGALALEEMTFPISEPSPPPAPKALRARSTLEPTAPKDVAQRDAARNVFAAKQSRIPTMAGAGKRKWILPVVAGILVLVGAGGWYVWTEINHVSQPVAARTPAQGQPALLPRAAPGTGQIGSKPVATADATVVVIEAAPLPPLLPPAAVEAPGPRVPLSSKPGSERALSDREALAKRLRDAPVAKEASVGLKLARSLDPPKLNPELVLAYQSLVNGDYGLAQRLYAKLASAEPLNVDAQLGLATAAARSGDKALARRHYRQVLVLDPRNGLAIMGLVALNDGAPPAALEIELKTVIGRNPDAAPLHFALGNIYAGELRWTEAQQAYFEAFRLDSVNPDYLFNLAVSLDQLHQPRLALDYYRKAEGIAVARGGGQFDRNTLAKRIRELSGEAGRSN